MDIMESIISETLIKRAELMESFVMVFLRETGLSIEDVEMVEDQQGSRIVWYMRKKGGGQ
jgi:hypothetical protein